MDRRWRCPVVFVQVADYYGFNPVGIKLIVDYAKNIRNRQEKS